MRFKEVLVAPADEHGCRHVNGEEFDKRDAVAALDMASQIVSQGEQEVSKLKSLLMDNRAKDGLMDVITQKLINEMEALLLEYITNFRKYRGFNTSIAEFTKMKSGLEPCNLWNNKLSKDIGDA